MPKTKPNLGGGQAKYGSRDQFLLPFSSWTQDESQYILFFHSVDFSGNPGRWGTTNGLILWRKLRPRGTCRLLGVSARSHSPGPHLVQELYRGPQDLPPLVHLDAVELLLQSQDLRPLCSRLGELAVGGTGPEWSFGLPPPAQLPTPSGYPLTPWPGPDCARTRRCGLSSPGTRGGKKGGC